MRGRLRERTVLHDEPSREHGGEHGGAGDDAERDEREPAPAAAQPGGDEPEGIGDATQRTPVEGLYWCLDCGATMSPRYDVPKAAPEPLREVQQFINSVDLEHELDWLPDWLEERGLAGELERARVRCARRCARSRSRTTARRSTRLRSSS